MATNQKPIRIALEPSSRLNRQTLTALEDLCDFVPPRKLSAKLRTLLLTYIRHQREMLPLDIDETLMEMELLMEFLDGIGEQ